MRARHPRHRPATRHRALLPVLLALAAATLLPPASALGQDATTCGKPGTRTVDRYTVASWHAQLEAGRTVVAGYVASGILEDTTASCRSR